MKDGGYKFVLISSWQAVVRGLIRDENDNAGAVRVIEDVKAAARRAGRDIRAALATFARPRQHSVKGIDSRRHTDWLGLKSDQ